MKNSPGYIIATGNRDHFRLSILNRLYNPGALAYMRRRGLRSGMKVLEIGCGTGEMAIELAKVVGSKGFVFALDNSDAQLEIAKKNQTQAAVENIKFLHLDLNLDLPKYQKQFDFDHLFPTKELCVF